MTRTLFSLISELHKLSPALAQDVVDTMADELRRPVPSDITEPHHVRIYRLGRVEAAVDLMEITLASIGQIRGEEVA